LTVYFEIWRRHITWRCLKLRPLAACAKKCHCEMWRNLPTANTALETRVSIVGTFTVSISTKTHLPTEHISYLVGAGFFICISLPQCWKLGGSNIGACISHIDTPPLAKMGCPWNTRKWYDITCYGSYNLIYLSYNIVDNFEVSFVWPFIQNRDVFNTISLMAEFSLNFFGRHFWCCDVGLCVECLQLQIRHSVPPWQFCKQDIQYSHYISFVFG